MSTYIANNHIRESFLFANYFLHTNNNDDIVQFQLENMYDAVLVSSPNVLILEQDHLQNNDVKNFFQDLDNKTISLKNTKLIILCSDNYSGQKYLNDNIKYIYSSSYLPYNEFYKPQHKEPSRYMLCSLDCSNLELNNALAPLVYPNNKTIPVKLINCPSVEHVQNLGVASEYETLELINNCCCYINIDNKYVYDAMLMNKPIINLVPNKYLNVTQDPVPSCDLTLQYSNEQIEQINQYKISNLLSQIMKTK